MNGITNTFAIRRILPILFTFSWILLFPSLSWAEGDAGVLFGNNHAFKCNAPSGWLLDNRSGISQGLFMIFYPTGYDWSSAPVIVYGRSVTKTKEIETIENHVQATLVKFHNEGHVSYISSNTTKFKTSNGAEALIYWYEGDNWGNFEAAAYYEESKTINYLVFNARSKSDFQKHYKSFLAIADSYKNLQNIRVDVTDNKFEQLKGEAKQIEKTENGGEYIKALHSALGPLMGDWMSQCRSYEKKENTKYFEIVFRVQNNGTISEIYSRPRKILPECLESILAFTKLPQHKFDRFLYYLQMRITN